MVYLMAFEYLEINPNKIFRNTMVLHGPCICLLNPGEVSFPVVVGPACFAEVMKMADLTFGLYLILSSDYLLVVSFSAH